MLHQRFGALAMIAKQVHHPLAPVYDKDCRVLFLGTMPSPQSRADGFYYAHPRNRFWPVLAGIFGEPIPEGTEARRDFCLRHHIALWDVLASCVISGAADGSIREPKANSIETLLQFASIKAILQLDEKHTTFTIVSVCRILEKKHFIAVYQPCELCVLAGRFEKGLPCDIALLSGGRR